MGPPPGKRNCDGGLRRDRPGVSPAGRSPAEKAHGQTIAPGTVENRVWRESAVDDEQKLRPFPDPYSSGESILGRLRCHRPPPVTKLGRE